MKNTRLLESQYNVTFEEILGMSAEDFHDWCVNLRKTVVYLWDNHDLPPVVGYDDEAIISQFEKMTPYPIHHEDDGFMKIDTIDGEKNVIRNTTNIGNAVNSFFPTMMKTPIGYAGDGQGKSIYDFFVKDELLGRFETYAKRHFKRDSFYHYSNPIKPKDKRFFDLMPQVDDAYKFVEEFEDVFRKRDNGWDYWLCPVKEDAGYTGYDEKLKGQSYLTLNKKDIDALMTFGILPEHCSTNVDYERSESYTIRVYEKGQKLFPIGLKAFKISFSQYAVNFPPLTARFLIEHYTKHINTTEAINYYDSSMGWGGRLLGAMSVRDDIKIHYIGTDPNSDNFERYKKVEEFYKKHINKGGMFPILHNTTDMYMLGSEVIHENERFQQYKGKIDFSFTSPPYFEKEQYSQEDTQSFKKFPQYDLWRDGFLDQTIKTICEFSRPDRYACWNISDVQFGKEVYPLVEDSKKAFEKYGMRYHGLMKMALSPMPGGNRTKEDGTGTSRYTCKVGNLLLKYEPILVFYKPEK